MNERLLQRSHFTVWYVIVAREGKLS